MVEHQFSKLRAGVRFSYPALVIIILRGRCRDIHTPRTRIFERERGKKPTNKADSHLTLVPAGKLTPLRQSGMLIANYYVRCALIVRHT